MDPPRIDGYRVLDRIGEGGTSVVYLAERDGDGTLVALKVLKPGTEVEENQIRRLMREAKVGRELRHPHILPVQEIREWSGQRVLVFEYVRGTSLRDWGREAPRGDDLEWARTLRILARVADALDHAHRHGVIHRDVKPANVLVREDGHPFLIDFGLARRVEADSTLTPSDLVLGSPPYMSPEQIRGPREALDHRTDIYSLGATTFEAVTGRFPFLAQTSDEMLLKVLYEEPPRLSEVLPSAPTGLEGIVLRALEKEPRHRYARAAEMGEDLERVAQGIRPRSGAVGVLLRRKVRGLRRLRLRIASGLAAAAVLVALGLFFAVREAGVRADFARLLADGDREFGMGRSERALLAYRGAAERAPDRPEPYLRQASVLADHYLYAEAARCLRMAEERGHPFPGGATPLDRYHLGLRHLLKEEFRESVDAFEEALAGDPDLFEAHLLRYRALHRLRRGQEARKALERFRESRNELDPLHTMARSLLAFLDGDPRGAVGALEALGSRKPSSEQPIWLETYLAMGYARLEDLPAAIEHLERAIERTKPEPLLQAQCWSHLGGLHASAGRFEEATSCARAALEVHPDSLEANRLLALVETARGNLEGARSYVRRERERDPDDRDLMRFESHLIFLAADRVLRSDGGTVQERDTAYAQIERCLELNPEHLGALLRHGMRLWTRGRHGDALLEFEKAAKSSDSWVEPADRPPLHWDSYFRDPDVQFDVRVGLFGTASQVGRADLATDARGWLRDEYEREPNRDAASLLNLAEALAECPVEALRDCPWARRLVQDHSLHAVYRDRPDARAILEKVDRLCP